MSNESDYMRLFGARARIPLLILLLTLAGLAAFLSPVLTAAVLLAALLLLSWERAASERSMRRLAATLASDDVETKLEVSGGAWGELCHAVNRLLQQRRGQQRLQRLIAAPPAPVAARLAEMNLPLGGTPCDVAVLAIGPLPGPDDPLDRLRELAFMAAHQAELHAGLLVRSGDRLLLIFGGLGDCAPEAALRSALRAAFGLRDAWANRGGQPLPTLSLAGGVARGIVLPGLGYSVIGPPVDQALALLDAGQPAALICSESAYVSLRRLGSAPPLSAAPRLSPAVGPTAYAVPL